MWKNSLNKKYFLKNKIINLNLIKDWNLTKKKISHETNNYFSVIGIKVKTNKRNKLIGISQLLKDQKCPLLDLIKNLKIQTIIYADIFLNQVQRQVHTLAQ